MLAAPGHRPFFTREAAAVLALPRRERGRTAGSARKEPGPGAGSGFSPAAGSREGSRAFLRAARTSAPSAALERGRCKALPAGQSGSAGPRSGTQLPPSVAVPLPAGLCGIPRAACRLPPLCFGSACAAGQRDAMPFAGIVRSLGDRGSAL